MKDETESESDCLTDFSFTTLEAPPLCGAFHFRVAFPRNCRIVFLQAMLGHVRAFQSCRAFVG